jgi:hypothetical protein
MFTTETKTIGHVREKEEAKQFREKRMTDLRTQATRHTKIELPELASEFGGFKWDSRRL